MLIPHKLWIIATLGKTFGVHINLVTVTFLMWDGWNCIVRMECKGKQSSTIYLYENLCIFSNIGSNFVVQNCQHSLFLIVKDMDIYSTKLSPYHKNVISILCVMSQIWPDLPFFINIMVTTVFILLHIAQTCNMTIALFSFRYRRKGHEWDFFHRNIISLPLLSEWVTFPNIFPLWW